MECDLQFLGLLVMKNTLKVESAPTIKRLQAANIRSVMVTGRQSPLFFFFFFFFTCL